MLKNTFFILGDSTSMSIGIEQLMYPFFMAKTKCWPEYSEIVNCSQPGITSADACAFFFRHHKKIPFLKAVILHLGTCDSVSSEISKGKYTRFRQIMHSVKEFIGIHPVRSSLKNSLLRYEWNNTNDMSIEHSERPEDFEYNLSRIIKACAHSDIPVIIIRPMSHLEFPAGVGKGNFIFYRYLGIRDKICDKISIPDKRFAEALKLHEDGNFSTALELYKEILFNSGKLSSNQEYLLLVVNNYAVCSAENGQLDEAEYLFELLLKDNAIRREIVLYNLAHLSLIKGNKGKYNEYLSETYETDSSMYRIRTPYIKIIDHLVSQFNGIVDVIDQQSFIGDELYIDHCHPVSEGQKMIADRIVGCLTERKITTGTHEAKINNLLYNPELALGNNQEFYKYFKTYAPYTHEQIKAFVQALKDALEKGKWLEKTERLYGSLPREIKWSFEYYLKHPCFPSKRHILQFGPEYPFDTGRFPEFYLTRYILPYLRVHEKIPDLQKRFSREIGVLRSSEELVRALPPDVVPLISFDDPVINADFERERLGSIISKAETMLLEHLKNGNQVYERIKTTIYWYFREALRFGSHSRISMRYDRVLLEYIAESLAVAGVLDLSLGGKRSDEIVYLISLTEQTVNIHNLFCKEFSLQKDSHELLGEYDKRLLETAEVIENHMDGTNAHRRNISILS
jgi:tetratricopeptide (TPR) repeat protein